MILAFRGARQVPDKHNAFGSQRPPEVCRDLVEDLDFQLVDWVEFRPENDEDRRGFTFHRVRNANGGGFLDGWMRYRRRFDFSRSDTLPGDVHRVI